MPHSRRAEINPSEWKVPINTCDNKTCPRSGQVVPDSQLKRCARCQIAWYCSSQCQSTAWKDHHRAECRERPTEQIAWVNRIRQHMALVKNTADLRNDILRDARQAYYASKLQRGAMVISLTDKIDHEVVDHRGLKSQGIEGIPLSYRYMPLHDAVFQTDAQQYADVIEMIQMYDPDDEFVLVALCSDADKGRQCHSAAILSAP